MKRKLSLVLACLLLVMVFAAGCGRSESSGEKKVEKQVENTAFQKAEADLEEALRPLPEKDTGVKLAAIESTLANSFWITMQEGYEDAAKEYGVTIDVLATESEDDTEGQLSIMNDLMVKDYAGIAVSPLTEHNLIPGIAEANKKGITVVAVGNGVDQDAMKKANATISAFITLDFKAQGTMGAEYIIEKAEKKGKVAILEGIPGATQSEARKNGAKEAFEKAGMNIVAVKTANFDMQQAYDATAAIVEANPDLVGITCGNDTMALGAVQALTEKGVKDQVAVVGVDFIEEAKASIEEGKLDATVAMSPYLFGKAGVITLLKAIRGDSFSEEVIWTPLSLVTKDNVDSMEGWK